MKVTHVALRPTQSAVEAGTPALTPELLAATGARYSRSNDGLQAILDRIDPEQPDKSVDTIFRMIDYGHQSIADMAPVAMFLDDISIHLAYTVWSVCSTAGGQESSTRYLDLSGAALPDPDPLGIPAELHAEWRDALSASFAAYNTALNAWRQLAEAQPERTRIPRELLDDESPKARKAVDRMRRNYAFDRARYFLPAAVPTNMMLVMSARGWTQLCQHLASHILPEARALAAAIQDQLLLCTPRLVKHACRQPSMERGLQQQFEGWVQQAARGLPDPLNAGAADASHPDTAHLAVFPPDNINPDHFPVDLAHHENRYAWIGQGLRRTAVRFEWDAVSLAELRDLNRHRTGTKYCPLVPLGFYAAADQVPQDTPAAAALDAELPDLVTVGQGMTRRAHELLASGDPSYVYWTVLGTQYAFEHTTTADKFIYEAELRTGVGSHYRYAKHLHYSLALWYAKFPDTKDLILEGSAEPE